LDFCATAARAFSGRDLKKRFSELAGEAARNQEYTGGLK
jgi:hypothetical protein